MSFKRILLCVLIFSASLQAQIGVSGKLQQSRSLLKQIEAQINDLRVKITSSKKRETTVLEQIALIDHEMALVQRSRGILQQEVRLLNIKIDSTRLALDEAQKRLQNLRKLYARRAVYAYKYGPERVWESILTSHSLNQALVRLKYLKQIARHDEALMRLIQKKMAHIDTIRIRLQQSLQQKQAALAAIKAKERIFLARKKEKKTLLRKLKWSRKTYVNRLKQKEHERQNLMEIIASLEKNRKLHKKIVLPTDAPPGFKLRGLARAKGKLPWPVKGKIVTHFGTVRDRHYKTKTKNLYVEIKAREGTPVRCVFPGIVRAILYMPDFGNTVLVDHGKGYYTIYAHLSEIDVFKNSFVDRNQIIGKVGESGYFGPVRFRFSIFGPRGMQNPERWLE